MPKVTFSKDFGPYVEDGNQNHLYDVIKASCSKSVYPDLRGDYIQIDSFGDVDYYIPNNEEWGAIIAISEIHGLAVDTGFYEMDDMAAEHGEYAQVVHGGELKCKFETEK